MTKKMTFGEHSARVDRLLYLAEHCIQGATPEQLDLTLQESLNFLLTEIREQFEKMEAQHQATDTLLRNTFKKLQTHAGGIGSPAQS